MFDFGASVFAWSLTCTDCAECVAAYNKSSDALFNSAEDECNVAMLAGDWIAIREWRAIRQSLTWEAQTGIEKFD